MPDSDAKRRWMKEHTVMVNAKLNRNTDPDIIEYLQGKQIATIIKAALREYMERHPD